MAWIPHVMVLDDDARVLDSLVPSFLNDLARALGKHPRARATLRPGESGTGPLQIKATAHGYEGERLRSYRHRSPHQVHVHLVRERGGRFDLARRLMNQHLFAVVVSDLRFSDEVGGQRAGQLFIDEMERLHPETVGLLYSAYPRPEGFPPERFVRKGSEGEGSPLVDAVVQAMDRHLADPSIDAFASAVSEQGLVYQSEAFGSVLTQVYSLARLLGPEASSARPLARSRKPLPTVLIDGESGTGKRGISAVFHAASERRKAPMTVASCNELTNETLLRSILFGHKRGAFTDAREDRAGLVATAGKGVIVLDDFHRLPAACSAILHSFLEDGEYSRLGEEEARRQAECAAVLTVETQPWAERRRSGELPLAFLARVERLPVEVPPLRDRPEDIAAQARWLIRVISAELGADLDLSDEAVESLQEQSFADSNSRELRNVIERAAYGHYREADTLDWSHLRPYLSDEAPTSTPARSAPAERTTAAPRPALNDWQKRLRALAAKILAKGQGWETAEATEGIDTLFNEILPRVWQDVEQARGSVGDSPIPMPVWDDVWRCFAVSWLGGPTPAEKVLGIPANTLRQWVNDRESR